MDEGRRIQLGKMISLGETRKETQAIRRKWVLTFEEEGNPRAAGI